MGYQDYDHELHSQSLIREDINFKQVENALAYNKDVEYMKQLFPSALQVIQSAVDDECDKLEYSGSVMFDEYPDKTHLQMIVDNIMLRLTASDEDDADGEVHGASLDNDSYTMPSYCPDDAMLDCEDDMVSATGLDEAGGPGPVKESWGWGRGPGWGPGRGPGWGPGRGPGWGGPGFPPGPWGPGRCYGPLCPIANRRCGPGRWCPPFPFADYDSDGNPNWMKHLVENMLTNEMTYRRSRYRNHNL